MISAENIKTQIQALIDKSNETTGNTDTDLTAAVESLINGYGKSGDSGANPLDHVTQLYFAYSYSSFEEGTELDITFGNALSEQPIGTTNVLGYTFYRATGLKSVKVTCGYPLITPYNIAHFYEGVNNNNVLEKVDLSGMNALIPNSINRTFSNCKVLKEVIGDFDLTNCASSTNAFYYCNALEEIRFVEKTIYKDLAFATSPLLSDKSIQSIIDGLADLTDTDLQTITFHSDVVDKLTDEQYEQIESKNWAVG